MDQWSRDNDVTCRLDGCDNPPGKRSAYCSVVHRIEGRRASKRDYMRRERGWTDTLDEPKIPQSGRSIPGQSADAYTRTTQHHPSRLWARRDEPELVDYTQPGAANRPSVLESRPVPTGQRYRAPSVEDDSWTPQADDYYSQADFRQRNDMSQGPYSNGNMASSGTPVQFQVVRRSR